ncbi:Mediator of RNA polymerase II transcription subunit 6 [Microbotryomycetes sp. JL221]|nr:Mediator of RNA polymerase II transcription subunit 6 [Microbotryomycetes sp. JL221]
MSVQQQQPMQQQQTLDPSTNLSHIQWRAAEWLLAFGPLTPTTVMDYFVMSPFFDRTSNNATLRMQMQFSRGGMDGVDEDSELRRFVGTEYAVVHAAPPSLFIIHKRDRKSPNEVTPIAAYYVLNDSVYQAPSLHSVVNERIFSSLYALSTSLDLLKAHKPRWTPETQYAWQVRPPLESDVATSAATALLKGNIADTDGLTRETATLGKKRPRDDQAESSEELSIEDMARVTAKESLDELSRSDNAFNPMLFRALQTVASKLPQRPAVDIAQNEGPSHQPADPTKENTPLGTSGTKDAGDSTQDGNSGHIPASNGVRSASQTNKRKP